MLIHAFILVWISAFYPWQFYEAWDVVCIKQLHKWLLIYAVIELLHLLERSIVCLCWIYATDPAISESVLYLFSRLWLYIFEVSWIIYGSTFVFSDPVKECKKTAYEMDAEVKVIERLWKLSLTTKVLIIYGYSLILWMCCSCCFGIALYKTYQSWISIDAEYKKVTFDGEIITSY